MFAQVHRPKDGSNKGSCSVLVNYLNKEKEFSFFSLDQDNVPLAEVQHSIDKNVQKLTKDDDKFYMISINPSKRELQHLVGRDIYNSDDLTDQERLKLEKSLQDYTHEVMNVYAQNFKRDTIKDGSDLVYFARIEKTRHYKYYDDAVLKGDKQTGDIKDGLNYHVHVIVSRKSADNKVKLSPLAKSAGNEWELKDRGTVKRGFSHEDFKILSQEKFDKSFNYLSPDAYIKTTLSPEQILKQKHVNDDLKEVLTDWNFQNTNQVSFLMKQRGYKCEYQQGKHIYTNRKETTFLYDKEIKEFLKPLSNDKLSHITKGFNLHEFEQNPTAYKQGNIIIEERSFLDVKEEKRNYYVLHDPETKTSANVTKIKEYAKDNDISIIGKNFLHSVKNEDLRETLKYNAKNLNDIKLLMSEKGYTMSFVGNKIHFSKSQVPFVSYETSISYNNLMGFIEHSAELKVESINDFSTLININDLNNEALQKTSFRIFETEPKTDLKDELNKYLSPPNNYVLRSSQNYTEKPEKFVIDEVSKDIFNIKQYNENLNPTNFSRDSILKEIATNPDLKEILSSYHFQNANQVCFLMEQRVYKIDFEYGKLTFENESIKTALSHKKINSLVNDLPKENLTQIAKGFNLYEFEQDPTAYNKNNIIVEKRSFTDTETNKDHPYYILHDPTTKTSVSVASIKEFAKDNDINIYDFRIENILQKIGNEDLKSLLLEHDFTKVDHIAYLMGKRGYDVSFQYGNYTFTKDSEQFNISAKLINEFKQSLDVNKIKNIADNFNLYEFEQNPTAYNKNNIIVEERTFQRQYSDGWKDEKYYIIHDLENKASLSLSELKHFAHENNIVLSKPEHISSVSNTDLKECLTFNIKNSYDLKLLMLDRGYHVSGEDGKVVFKKDDLKISLSPEVLKGFIEFKDIARNRAVNQIANECSVLDTLVR